MSFSNLVWMGLPFGIAALLLCIGLTNDLPAKSELTYVSGVPTGVEFSTLSGRRGYAADFVAFSLGDYRLDYAGEEKGYQELVDALKRRKRITVGVAPRRVLYGLLGDNEISKICHVRIGNSDVISYEDVLERKKNSDFTLILASAVAFVFGVAVVLLVVLRNPGPAERNIVPAD